MGTLVHDPFFADMPSYFGTTLEALVPQLRQGTWVDFELGRIDQRTLFERFFHDGRSFDHATFLEHVRASYRWLDGVEALLAELLERRVTMHVLSNYPIWWKFIEERLELSRYVPWTFVSCHTGVRKPAPDAYLGPARLLGVEPGRCLLIDDRASNCEAAERVGMPAIHRTTMAALRAALRARGIL